MNKNTVCIFLVTIIFTSHVNLFAQNADVKGFFNSNIARCFYCDENGNIDPSFTARPIKKKPEATPMAMMSKTMRHSLEINRANNKDKHNLLGVSPSAPEPFKKLIEAYEAGDIANAERYAREWIRYKRHLVERTENIARLVAKVEKDMDQDVYKPNINNILFFISADSKGAKLLKSAKKYIERSRLMPSEYPPVEMIFVVDNKSDIDAIKKMLLTSGIRATVQYDKMLFKSFNVDTTPYAIGIRSDSGDVCDRNRGIVSLDDLKDLVEKCS